MLYSVFEGDKGNKLQSKYTNALKFFSAVKIAVSGGVGGPSERFRARCGHAMQQYHQGVSVVPVQASILHRRSEK